MIRFMEMIKDDDDDDDDNDDGDDRMKMLVKLHVN